MLGLSMVSSNAVLLQHIQAGRHTWLHIRTVRMIGPATRRMRASFFSARSWQPPHLHTRGWASSWPPIHIGPCQGALQAPEHPTTVEPGHRTSDNKMGAVMQGRVGYWGCGQGMHAWQQGAGTWGLKRRGHACEAVNAGGGSGTGSLEGKLSLVVPP